MDVNEKSSGGSHIARAGEELKSYTQKIYDYGKIDTTRKFI